MKPTKQVLITFDYELFLGNRSGSVANCLINPTNQVLDVIEQHGCRAIFFVDTTYLLTLKKNFQIAACKQDFETVMDHITEIASRGHEIFPHLHPHWLDANYLSDTNEWQLINTDKYRFYHISEAERSEIFDQSIELLQQCVAKVNPSYLVDSYRAGGWCIQPFNAFLPYFIKHNIKFDFSVLGGFYLFSNAQYFDFSKAPQKTIYQFENDITTEQNNGRFTEFNISSIYIPQSIKLLEKLFLKLYYKITNDHSFSRGEGQIAVKIDKNLVTPQQQGHDILDSAWERIAIELMSIIKQGEYKKYLNTNEYMHFISHPKMLTRHNIKMFDKFLKFASEKYNLETDFRKMV